MLKKKKIVINPAQPPKCPNPDYILKDLDGAVKLVRACNENQIVLLLLAILFVKTGFGRVFGKTTFAGLITVNNGSEEQNESIKDKSFFDRVAAHVGARLTITLDPELKKTLAMISHTVHSEEQKLDYPDINEAVETYKCKNSKIRQLALDLIAPGQCRAKKTVKRNTP